MKYLESLKFSHDWWAIVLPCVLMLLDVVTGYVNARIKKNVSSSKMRKGLGNKLAELVYIVVGILISYAFSIKALGYFISIYVIYMELVSIIENCSKLGVKLPEKIKDKLEEK